jgi:diguanylate cyclase (GGDEF)-like protein
MGMKKIRWPSLSMDLSSSIERAELHGFARNASDIGFLLSILAGIYLVVPGQQAHRPGMLLLAFAAFIILFSALRFLPRFQRETRLKVAVQVLAMLVFTTLVLFSIERQAAALLSLYLLPVIVAALTLGRWPTLAVTVLSVLGFLLARLFGGPSGMPAGSELAEFGIALAPFLLVAYVTALLAHEIELARQRIRTLAETDELTGLANTRAFSRFHRQEHERAVRHGRPYSIIVMDLNALKQINDDYGQETGNRALILCANVIARLIRTTDAAARHGGDEFVLLVSEADAEQAQRVVHRIRSAVERCTIEVAGRMVRLSVSMGAATFPDASDDLREILACADEAMQIDKEARKAKVPSSGAPEFELV